MAGGTLAWLAPENSKPDAETRTGARPSLERGEALILEATVRTGRRQ